MNGDGYDQNRSFGAPYYRSADYQLRYPSYLRHAAPFVTTVNVQNVLHPRQFRERIAVATRAGKRIENRANFGVVKRRITDKKTRHRRRPKVVEDEQETQSKTTSDDFAPNPPAVIFEDNQHDKNLPSSPLAPPTMTEVIAEDNGIENPPKLLASLVPPSPTLQSTENRIDPRKIVKNLPFPAHDPLTLPLAVDGENEFEGLPKRSSQTPVVQSTEKNNADGEKMRKKLPSPGAAPSEWVGVVNLVPVIRLRSPVIYCYATEYAPPRPSISPPIKRGRSRADPAKQLKPGAKHFENERCRRHRRRRQVTVASSVDDCVYSKMERAIRNAEYVVMNAKRGWPLFDDSDDYEQRRRVKIITPVEDRHRESVANECREKTEYVELQRLGLGRKNDSGRWVPNTKNKLKDKLVYFQ